MFVDENDYLEHYGVLRRSGRYPWGSSSSQNVRNKSFLDYIDDMKSQGVSEVDIARGVGISTTQLRAANTIALNQQKQNRIRRAEQLHDKGLSNVAVGLKMGINESSVRALLAPGAKEKADVLLTTANMLKKEIEEKGFIDIGKGQENHIGVSQTKLMAAVAILKEDGYNVYYKNVPQVGTGLDTKFKVLAAPAITYKEFAQNIDKLGEVERYTEDGGLSYLNILPPLSVNPKRVAVKYGDEGGTEADGVMYIRPGVKDISLDTARYAQVRVLVGKDHYIKGMAMYRDDLPEGVDILFNTNKMPTGNKLDALKPVTGDVDNPFGAVIKRQITKTNADNSKTVTSAMNLVNEEGDWTKWSKSLSTQVLSKQSPALAKEQLAKTYEQRLKQYDEIAALTNPTVRKKLLLDFSDDTEAASVHLKAAALPRQGWHAILPIKSISPSEVYAPNYEHGETVVLIRYPHGGRFEIPELTVNNRHPESKRLLGSSPRDAIGIHSSVAERLSGADFDGDNVLVIPNNSKKISVSPALEGLKDFNPRVTYRAYEGMPKVKSQTMQTQMGDVSNLITDMTIRRASSDELARAVRHSMVVIDSENHNLDYKASAIDNNIKQLKQKYQTGPRSGATTLISLASSKVRVPERTPRRAADGGPIDKVTGKRVYVETGANYTNKDGKTVYRTTKSKRLAETDDAFTLSSGTPVERVYAEHSNKLKALGDLARKDMVNTPLSKYSPSAKKTYTKEVASLNSQLALALRNAPLERQAQVIANTTIKAKRDAYPDMDAKMKKKMESQALIAARIRTGAKKKKIEITENEWDAIQAGAITDTKLSAILANADMSVVKKLATPRTNVLMSPTNVQRAQSLFSAGRTRSEVAAILGVSLTTLDRGLNPDG